MNNAACRPIYRAESLHYPPTARSCSSPRRDEPRRRPIHHDLQLYLRDLGPQRLPVKRPRRSKHAADSGPRLHAHPQRVGHSPIPDRMRATATVKLWGRHRYADARPSRMAVRTRPHIRAADTYAVAGTVTDSNGGSTTVTMMVRVSGHSYGSSTGRHDITVAPQPAGEFAVQGELGWRSRVRHERPGRRR